MTKHYQSKAILGIPGTNPGTRYREGTKQLLEFYRCFGRERGYWISYQHLQETNVTGQYIHWDSFSPKTRKISFIKTLIHRALMICSKTKLGPELDKIKQLPIENGYPADVLLSCINQKLANFAAEKTFDPEKCQVYLKLPWIGNVSSKFENQFSKAITSCYYVVKPRVVYNTTIMLASAKNNCVPTTQTSCVVYEFSCRCEARYVGRITQRLADKIKQHVPASIRKKSYAAREQPPRICKKNNSKINCESAIG